MKFHGQEWLIFNDLVRCNGYWGCNGSRGGKLASGPGPAPAPDLTAPLLQVTQETKKKTYHLPERDVVMQSIEAVCECSTENILIQAALTW